MSEREASASRGRGRNASPAPADFSSDEGALAYAYGKLDELVDAMRYSLEKQIAGWPPDDRELNTYEAIRHLFRNLSFLHAGYLEADADNPTLTKMGGTNRIQFQLQSPDCNYHMAVLHGDHGYRLRGPRGSAAVFQAQVGHGRGTGGWKVLSVVNNLDEPAFAAGKTLDVVLSREKPADLAGAYWLPLPEGQCELHLRQYYGDWESEEPADLILTREGQTFPSKLLTRQTLESRFQSLVGLLRNHADFHRAGVRGHLASPADEIGEVPVPGAFEGTHYFFGHFRCRPDQAVIIDIDPPRSVYWNVELSQLQWEPGDYWSKLVSYNLTQVRPEADGSVRWVASWSDPGVPNWFDCSGRVLHLIGFRFFRAQAPPARPRVRTVPLSELGEHVSADTPRITPEERRDLMERRLVSVYRRRFSDF